MYQLTGTHILIILIVIVIIVFVMYNNKSYKEGYTRSCLGNDCYGLQRTPVDYAEKNPYGWQRNPHWKAKPSDEHQPLEFGPIDFHAETRKLNENNGILFQQYRNDWPGCGKNQEYLVNDSKNRFDLLNQGDMGARRALDNMNSPRFYRGSGVCSRNELDSICPDKYEYWGRKYGGGPRYGWLHHDKLGD